MSGHNFKVGDKVCVRINKEEGYYGGYYNNDVGVVVALGNIVYLYVDFEPRRGYTYPRKGYAVRIDEVVLDSPPVRGLFGEICRQCDFE